MKKALSPSGADRLATEKTGRLIAGFALTAFAGLLLNSVYSLTDALFVSWCVGDDAMGGISAVYPFVILQGAISTAIGGGAATLVSRRLGEGKSRDAAEITLSAMTAFYVTAISVTALGFALMPQLLVAMGATGTLAPYAKTYFSILLAGNVFSTGFSSVIRAEGKNLYSLLIWVIPITLNIALDAVFITALGLGVAGSAAATVTSQAVSFSMSVLFFARFSVQRFENVRPRLRAVGDIAGIGIPALIQTGSLSVISIAINYVLSKTDGEIGVTAFGYVTRLLSYAVIPFAAVTQALSPVAGYNYGAGNISRVRSAIKICLCAATVCGVALLLISEAAAPLFLRAFTSDEAILKYGTECMRITAAALPFMPFSTVAGATAQAIGRKSLAAWLYASAPLIFLPLAFGLQIGAGTTGLWWAFAAAYAAAALLALVYACTHKDILLCAPPYERHGTLRHV